ncbi:MAG: hypothetical protein JEZ07_17260 [Phycisphaerae bacterium]|nr:hypothetical protein [Phycisphaerae bacterium]
MMKKLMILVLCLLVAGTAQAIPVADNFTDGVLDTSKWTPVVKDGSEVIEYPGYITMAQVGARPYMATVDSWDPLTQGTLTVTATVNLNLSQVFVVWTRSSGDYDSDGQPNLGGTIGSGLRFNFSNDARYGVGIFTKEDAVWPWLSPDGYSKNLENWSPVAGDWHITVIDTGSQVSLEVVNAADPTNYATATANTTFVPAVTSNKLAFNCLGKIDSLYINSGNPAASEPTPDNKAVNVAVDAELSWTAPEAFTQEGFRVYFGTTEPNYLSTDYGLNELTNGIEDITTILPSPSPMANDTTYYWVVDSYESGASSPSLGDTWSFTTIPAVPVIADGTPSDTAGFPGEDAVLTVEFDSESAITSNIWEKSTDDGATWTTATGTVTLDEASTPKISELTINGIASADEAIYRCVLANSGGSDTSESAVLALKALKGHWTLDQADFNSNAYLDVSGYGHDATKLGPEMPTFVSGADGNTTGAVGIFDPNYVSTAGTWDPTEGTGEFTMAAWVKWGGNRGGLFSKRNNWAEDDMMFHSAIETDGFVSIARRSTYDITVKSNIKVQANEWNHVAIAFGGSSVSFFIDGVLAGTSPFTLGTGTDVPITIGALTPWGALPFSGWLDDIQVYNYALTNEEVIDICYPITGEEVCIAMPALDIANGDTGLVKGDEGFEGDCKVDLFDFAHFAAAWLECGIYPAVGCN